MIQNNKIMLCGIKLVAYLHEDCIVLKQNIFIPMVYFGIIIILPFLKHFDMFINRTMSYPHYIKPVNILTLVGEIFIGFFYSLLSLHC
ncbi:MAG TPA: hypothetical protein LFW20_01250 [Rickettsia endosymbiont of Omalisus fontisbellaquei]|nr:hypothetical protein [Rickettsia endosymbiont of Omalisus fontisbellaquei]